MSNIDELYAALAAGTPHQVVPGFAEPLLLANVRKAARSETLEERLDGARVAAGIGGRDAMETLQLFLSDPDTKVRAYTLELAIHAGEFGRPLVRLVAEDTDTELALAALAELTRTADKAASKKVRALLKHPSPKIRQASLVFLGQNGGASMRHEIEPLSRDPDAAVSAAAAEALHRIDGGRPRQTGNAPTGVPTPAPVPPVPPPIPPVPSSVHETPVTTHAFESAAETQSSPTPEAPPTTPAPHDPVATAKAIGNGAPLTSSFDAGSMAAIQNALRGDKDPALARGVARLAVAQNWSPWTALLKPMLTHTDPSVRSEAGSALAAIGAASLFPAVLGLLADADPKVRVAGIQAAADMGLRLKKERFVHEKLQVLAGDTDATVKAARDAAAAKLGLK